ncbi:MAG: hypothetical protein ACFFD4_27640 [Candidatus Odinarchaeota archaeon]
MEKRTAMIVLTVMSVACILVPVVILGTNSLGYMKVADYAFYQEEGILGKLFCFVAMILNGTIIFLSAKMKFGEKMTNKEENNRRGENLMEKRAIMTVLPITSIVCILVPVVILGTNSGGFMNGDYIAAYMLDQGEAVLALLFWFAAIILNGTILFISVNTELPSKEK